MACVPHTHTHSLLLMIMFHQKNSNSAVGLCFSLYFLVGVQNETNQDSIRKILFQEDKISEIARFDGFLCSLTIFNNLNSLLDHFFLESSCPAVR